MGALAAQGSISSSQPARPALVATAVTINVLGLAVPIAVSLVFNRVLPHPGSATLQVVIALVVTAALAEAVLRFCRSYLLAYAGAIYTWRRTHRALEQLMRGPVGSNSPDTATSLEYMTAIQQTRDKYNGQLIVSVCDLVFLPLIVACICLISLPAAALIGVVLTLYGALIVGNARRLVRTADAQAQQADSRYKFLFDVLSAASTVKSLTAEEQMVRRFEERQRKLVEASNRSSGLANRLVSLTIVGGQVTVATMLVFGALAVSEGAMSLGDVSALVLLGGRIMPPVQRALFTLVQMRSVRQADAKLERLAETPLSLRPNTELALVPEGRIQLRDASFSDAGRPLLRQVSLDVLPGETVVIHSDRNAASTALLQMIAGVVEPDSGEALLDGVAAVTLPDRIRNRAVGLLARDATLFRGTIRDNITRFGEVAVADAMQVAALLEVDMLIDQLPLGLETPIQWSSSEAVSPGLRQIVSFVRALASRPRIVLLDNVGQQLDPDSYDKVHRFIARISGQATIVIVSDDANLDSVISRQYQLIDGTLSPETPSNRRETQAYSNIRV